MFLLLTPLTLNIYYNIFDKILNTPGVAFGTGVEDKKTTHCQKSLSKSGFELTLEINRAFRQRPCG